MRHSALIIDDDEIIRSLITDILEPFGFTVRTAATAEDGRESARGHRPDLIICDMILPDALGSETALEFRRDPSLQNVPIILVTGYPYLEKHAQHLNCALLTKPFSMNRIVEMAQEAVGVIPRIVPAVETAPLQLASAA
jgi:CheY-like chemotaxis protein